MRISENARDNRTIFFSVAEKRRAGTAPDAGALPGIRGLQSSAAPSYKPLE
jgi:hypothetical protein